MKKTNAIYGVLLAAMAVQMQMTTVARSQETEIQIPTTLSETYDAWTVQCANTMEGEQARRTCQMSQELLQQESRQRLLLFAITKKGESSAKATLIMPFGLLLSEGVRVQIAEKELVRSAYRTCLPAGCIAEFDLPDASIEQLKTADTASVLMTVHTGQPMKTDVSLKGFAAAYRRLLALTAG